MLNSVAPKVVTLAYNADGQYTSINRYANLAATQLVATSTYGYDADGDVTTQSHDEGSTNLNSYTYTYLCSCQLRAWDYSDYSEKSAVVVWVAPQLARNPSEWAVGSPSAAVPGVCDFRRRSRAVSSGVPLVAAA